jgi:hypothetical protein
VRRLLDLARAENLAPSGESTSIAAALALLPADNRLAIRVEAGGDIGVRISAENAAIVLANLSTIRRAMARRSFRSRRRALTARRRSW